MADQDNSPAYALERGTLVVHPRNTPRHFGAALGMPTGCYVLPSGHLLITARDLVGNSYGLTVDANAHDIRYIGRDKAGDVVVIRTAAIEGWTHVFPTASGFMFVEPKLRSLVHVDMHGQTIAARKWGNEGGCHPWSACQSSDGGFVISDWRNRTIHYLDSDLRLLASLPCGEIVVEPRSVEFCPGDHVLVADGSTHQVVELGSSGNKVWQFGRHKQPADDLNGLCNPWSSKMRSDGIVLIADTRNHRILGIDKTSSSVAFGYGAYFQGKHNLELCTPTDMAELPDGHLLICDGGNGRVIRVSASGEVVWVCGSEAEKRRTFSFPRSVIQSAPDALMVADTYNNRVIELSSSDQVLWELTSCLDVPLYWPRCARVYGELVVVADGRGGRVVCVRRDKSVVWSIDNVKSRDKHQSVDLSDPHDVSISKDGHVLITDAGLDAVMEVDTSGSVSWCIGGQIGSKEVGLLDPHTAQYRANGTVLICDSGNNRIVIVDPEDQTLLWECSQVQEHGSSRTLRGPKQVSEEAEGIFLVLESETANVTAINEKREVLWTCQPRSDDNRPAQAPRWCSLLSDGTALMSDYFGCRLLSFECSSYVK